MEMLSKDPVKNNHKKGGGTLKGPSKSAGAGLKVPRDFETERQVVRFYVLIRIYVWNKNGTKQLNIY